MCRPYLSLLAAAISIAALHAQSTDIPNAISGTVVDPSGAKVLGAEIHLQSGTTNLDTVSDRDGHFSFNLPAGIYTLHIEAPGFRPLDRTNLAVAGKPLAPFALRLAIASTDEVLNIDANATTSTSAADNGSALVFKKEQLNTLSSDEGTLQQELLAIAGGDGQHPPQLLIDGFSGGRFPPKDSIREVRINQNPYSTQYDSLGFGRIEIFTKPGSDKLHGNLQVQGNSRAFNARNPFTGEQPDYHTLFFDGSVGGPIGKITSWFAGANYNDAQSNAVVNAVTLDSNLQQTQVSQAVPNPTTTQTYYVRLDRQLTKNNTFTSRYEYNRSSQQNAGVGLLALASQGYNTANSTQTLQLGNTEIIGPHIVNETRFQYLRTRTRQDSNSNAPALQVQGSFSGGGNPAQTFRDSGDRYEFQDYLAIDHGKHFLRIGARYRLFRDANLATTNYNGQFTFPDIATYQRTLQGQAAGLTPAQIRAGGGGATQFNLTAGVPSASVLTGDLGVYAEDEWKLKSNLTLNYGLRFESQSAVPDHVDPAPRAGFAWAVRQRDKHPAWFTLRGGGGIFYDRFESGDILQTYRQNGITQQAYFVQNPDFYPSIPAPSTLVGVQPTIYRLAPRLRTAYGIISGGSVERSFGKIGSISANYLNFRGVHQYLSENANAPLPGTYNPGVPDSGVRPLGSTRNVYQFASDGVNRGSVIFVNTNMRPAKWVSFWGTYVWQAFKADAIGSTSFASDSYNVHADYSSAFWSRPNRLFTGASINFPRGFELSPFLACFNGRPFDITTGSDNNGDTIYNDRPSFATDLSRPSVMRTQYGNFDLNPTAGQRIIPANYQRGPALVSLQISLDKSFKFGPRPSAPPAAAAATPGAAAGSAPAGGPNAGKPDPPYTFGLSVESGNVFNHTNASPPIGVLTSPFFGRSISLSSAFGGNTAANRTVTLRTYFRF